MTIHKEGYKSIAIAVLLFSIINVLSFYFLSYSLPLISWLLFVITAGMLALVISFFRIPKRVHTTGENMIIAPADGKVVVIEETTENEYFKDRRLQVSIFMSVKNVHINRTPISGQVKYFKYHPGKYLLAWDPKSSTENERTTYVIEDEDDNMEILMRQIAGTVARRIKFYVEEGDEVTQGAEFGFIKFGSRVDLFLPLDSKIEVNIGEKVKGGQTVIARVARTK